MQDGTGENNCKNAHLVIVVYFCLFIKKKKVMYTSKISLKFVDTGIWAFFDQCWCFIVINKMRILKVQSRNRKNVRERIEGEEAQKKAFQAEKLLREKQHSAL
mgnify:CR=1 FL=1